MTLPGEVLGVSEEFVAGPGTVEEDGKIIAIAAGEGKTDALEHKLWVDARKIARPLAPGDPVYGIVQDLYESIALVEFQAMPQGGELPSSESRMAFVRISELDDGYVERLRDYLRIGDVIRARVLEVKALGIYLTLKDRELGVLRAFCSVCREEMRLQGREFACPQCGSREPRKLPSPEGSAGREGREESGGYGREGDYGGRREGGRGEGYGGRGEGRRNFDRRR